MIPLAIEAFCRTPQPRSLSNRSRTRRGEVVDQRPAPSPLLGGLHRAVEMLGAVQVVVEPPQQPVHRVARPVAAGVGLRPDERRPLVAQRPDLLPHDLLVHVGCGPLP